MSNLDKRSDKGLEIARAESQHIAGEQQVGSFFAQLKGFWLTFKTMFGKPETVAYPEVKNPTAPRFHGRHQLNRYDDGLEKSEEHTSELQSH